MTRASLIFAAFLFLAALILAHAPVATALAQSEESQIVGADASSGEDGATADGERIEEEIPPERLIEPPPGDAWRGGKRKGGTSAISFSVSELVPKVPSVEQWQRVLAALFNEPVEEKPKPPVETPEKPTPKPKPEAKPPPAESAPAPKPEEEKPFEQEILTTEQAVKLALEVKAKGLSKEYARVVVGSGRIKGNTQQKEYDMEGRISLYYRDITADAMEGHIDQNSETVDLRDSVRLVDPNYELSCEDLRIRFPEKAFVAKTFVKFKKKTTGKEPTGEEVPKRERTINVFKNEPTEVYANVLTYNWDTEEMMAKGEVKVLQKDLSSTMDTLEYNPSAKTYRMTGSVFMTLLDTEWIFENKLVEERDVDLARALTENETTIEADFVETGEDSDISTMRGNTEAQVAIAQDDKVLYADSVVFDDGNKMMTAEGSVAFYQQNGEWLRKGKLIEGEPDEDTKKFLEREVVSMSDQMTLNYDRRVLHQWGNVKVVSGDEMLVADDLVFDDTAKELRLEGNVTYFRGEDEYVLAEKLFIDTDKNIIRFSGISKSFLFTSEEDRKAAQKAGEEAAAGAEGETAPGEGVSTPPGTGVLTAG
jgi:lipopolysaccharide assembly outer membrane protein LptD (OstA)